MRSEGDRRAPGTSRVPFDALVEVGGELGPSFEAQAIDISEDGMHLRTAYLPEVGQPLVFRFDAGPGRQISAGGEVTWKQEEGKGGEFGVRFTNLDGESLVALGRILGVSGPPPEQPLGSRVRLHIDGLASPMRARVKEASGTELTAFSELGFLQVGKQLELEDAQSGKKRPACIDRVDVEIDEETRVPQLVVTLRYDDVPAHAIHEAEAEREREEEREAEPAQMNAHEREEEEVPVEHEAAPAEEPMDEEPLAESAPAEEPHAEAAPPRAATASPQESAPADPSIADASDKMRGAIARGAAKVGPALTAMMQRAKVTVALLAAKRRGGSRDDVAIPMRRTTAPPPGGALHASGRKVVRSEPDPDMMRAGDEMLPKKLVTKRRAMVGGAIGVAAILAVVALRKPAPEKPLASAPPPDTTTNGAPLTPPSLAGDGLTSTSATPFTPPDPMSLSPAAKDDQEKSPHKKQVAPFGNGPVAHGNTLHIKMDGPIDKLEGAQQPTGFTVVIPNRRSLEAAGPLAARDSRIASIHVSNENNGAELSLTFKDGVPNYQVRAKGDTLEIAIAPIGQVNDGKSGGGNHPLQAKHTDTGGKPHGKTQKTGHSKKD